MGAAQFPAAPLRPDATLIAGVEAPAVVRSGSLYAWWVAVRPRTLLVAISPVLVGASLGFERAGVVSLVAGLLALCAAMLMQVTTNLQNDVGYTVRGGESSGTRTGLPRATARGWLSVRQVRIAIALIGVVSLAMGIILTFYRGWPVLLIGAPSLLAALAYMGGPKPIAYTPFGELTVFVFFGLVAVMGTEWVLGGHIGVVSFMCSAAIGSLAAAALAVNNHRDIAHDRLVGRRTFAVIAGERASGHLYTGLLLGPFLLLPAIALCAGAPSLLLPLALLPMALRLHRDFLRCAPGLAYSDILFRTFRLELYFAIPLAAGVLLMRSLN
jgi:1,4-dihydroxy-2-naphthoate octaprenyltransferase